MTVAEDPINGRLTESRVGGATLTPDGPFARWGGTPAPPICGAAWLGRFRTDPARLSNGVGTDRQWYAFDFTGCLIKGFCRLDVIAAALTDERLHPIGACSGGEGPFAMATLWLNVIRDSVCGAYHEVVLSIDVSHSSADAVAFRVGASRAPWAALYPNFGVSVCDAQFLHSLWINSPLSITWGREMQGFPKHPQPVTSDITDDRREFVFDVRWGDDLVLRGKTRKRFGVPGFLREGWGLVSTHGPGRVLRFLSAHSFDVPLVMPAKTAAQNAGPRHYIGHLWKGLHPTSVKVWPWGSTDELELGDIPSDTGCEDHNGHRLLREASFRPVSVTYVRRAAAFVEEEPT